MKASRYSKVAKDLDSFGVPFRQSFAEALMEVSYGSGSIFGYLRSDIYYIDFLNNARNAKQIKILQPHTYVIGIIIIKIVQCVVNGLLINMVGCVVLSD